MTLKEKIAKLAEVSGKIVKVFKEAKTSEGYDLMKAVDLSGATAKERCASLQKMKDEEDGLGAEVDAAQKLQGMADESKAREEAALKAGRPAHPAPGKKGEKKDEDEYAHLKGKGLGDLFMKAIKGKSLSSIMNQKQEIEGLTLKTLMETSAGWASQAIRTGEMVPIAMQMPMVIDIIPQGTSDQTSVAYMEQTTRTNNAAERAEGATTGEAVFVYTARTVENEEIGVWLPATERQFEDVPALQGEINNDLLLMIRQRLSSQIINGDGTTPNIEGILAKSGIQTRAKGVDNIADAVYKLITTIRSSGYAEPDAHVFHPANWEDVRLMKDINGNYIWGHPSESGLERLWGKMVVVTTEMAENTCLSGAFAQYSKFYMRRGLSIQVTNSYASKFVEWEIAIRAGMRGGMVWKRPAAFGTVTALAG